MEENKSKKDHSLELSRLNAIASLSAGIAHEINNPLSIIHGNVEMIRIFQKERTEKVDNCLKKIEHATKRIADLVKDLRSFSRDRELDYPIVYTLGELLDTTKKFSEGRMKSKGVDYKFVENHRETKVRVRRNDIIQALLNLLENSLEAVVQSDQKEVSIETSIENQLLRISVKDSGPGLSPEAKERWMEPFFSTKPHTVQGVGLGLSTAVGLVEQNEGRLSYDEGQTPTSFSIFLPIES